MMILRPRQGARPRRLLAAAALIATSGYVGAVPASAHTRHASSNTHTYQYKVLNNPKDLTFNQLLGINNAGTIAGYFGSGMPADTHPNKGFVVTLKHGSPNFTDENFPGSAQTQVVGINSKGATAGFWVDNAGKNSGFVKKGAMFTSVVNPSGEFNQLLGINDNSKAVGFYNDTAGNSHAYVYDIRQRTFNAVSVPGAVSSQATGINDHGAITGFFTDASGNTSAFLVNGKKFQVLNYPDATQTQALGINNRGDIVGQFVDKQKLTHGFIWSHGIFSAIDEPQGVGSTTVNGINDKGQIVGFYNDTSGNTDGFLGTPNSHPRTATPAPAPATNSMTATPDGTMTNANSINLSGQPSGSVSLVSLHNGTIQATLMVSGLTPSAPGDPSIHGLEIDSASGTKLVTFPDVVADSHGQIAGSIDSATTMTQLPRGSSVVLRFGRTHRVGDAPLNGLALQPIATAPAVFGTTPSIFKAVEVGGTGSLSGHAAFSYDAANKTLTVSIVNATGFVPNSDHAAHIHSGTCALQGAPVYMLMPDLTADANGVINATRIIDNVASFTPPAGGWYLNIHQGSSASILVNGQPAPSFRPLLCGNIGSAVSSPNPVTAGPGTTTTTTAPPPQPMAPAMAMSMMNMPMATTTTTTTMVPANTTSVGVQPGPAPRHW